MVSSLPILKVAIASLPLTNKLNLKRWLIGLINNDILDSNSLAELVRYFQPSVKCPHCTGSNIIGHGNYRDWKRYKCKPCKKTFNDLSNTVFHYLHNHEQVKAYLKEMLNKKSLQHIAQKLDIHLEKSFFWRHKFCHALQKSNLGKLQGLIQADETFFRLSYKGQRNLIETTGQKARKRGGRASKRGISDQQIVVLAAIDSQNTTLLELGGRGKTTQKMCYTAFEHRISKQKNSSSILVTDGASLYRQFALDHKLIHKVLLATDKRFNTDEGFNLQKVNQVHQHLKQWMASFCGVATKYLQNYLNYFQTMKRIIHVKEQMKSFLRDLLSSNQAFVRYKDIKNRPIF